MVIYALYLILLKSWSSTSDSSLLSEFQSRVLVRALDGLLRPASREVDLIML